VKAPSNLIRTDWRHIAWLCERMRPDEIEQFRAFFDVEVEGQYSPDLAARVLLAKQGPQFTVMSADGTPAVAGGWDLIAEGVWSAWMVGSMAGWDENWRSITKSSRWLMSELFKTGARRLEMAAIASRCQAHRWYERGLGMSEEGIKRGYGRNGEDVHLFGVLREDWKWA